MDDEHKTDLPNVSSTSPEPENSQEFTGTGSASAASSGTTDYSGTVLGGYQIVRLIAEGGMGVVYEAVQLNLSRKVAVKILSEQLAARPEFLLRFQREAKAAAALNHPNMVQVHDFCQAQGQSCLVMEYVEGQDLSDYAEAKGKLPVHEALDIIEQAALALRAACEKSIIHRDIKPSNLMLTREGCVKVSDLGLAKILNDASELTLTGVGMGSPYFMAPEQASDMRAADHRADIYSLGLTLLYLLTGKRPFDGHTPFSIVLAHANKPLPRGLDLGTELPAEVERLIQKMAAKNPLERYRDYDTLLMDLSRVKAGHAPALDLDPVPRKYFSPAAILATAAVLMVFLAAAAFLLHRQTRTVSAKQSVAPPDTIVQKAEAAAPAPALPRPAQSQPVALSQPSAPPPKPVFTGNPTPWITSKPSAQPERERPGPPDRFGQGPPPELEEGPPDRQFRGPPSGGTSTIASPLGRLPPPSSGSLQDGAVADMLAQADAYAAAHPQDYRDLVDRYRQVATKARGTSQERDVSQKLSLTIQQHQGALRSAMQDYQAKMDQRLRAQQPQEAYDVWKDFPQNLRTFESDQQITQILQRQLPPGFVPR